MEERYYNSNLIHTFILSFVSNLSFLSLSVHALCIVKALQTLLFSMQARNKQLAKTMEEFDQVGEVKEQDGEDLLDLLDAACSTK